MSIVKFITSVGFKRRSPRSEFYDLTINNTKYSIQLNRNNDIAIKNNTLGGQVSVMNAANTFNEKQIVLLLNMHDVFDELISFLNVKMRLNIIDEVIQDLKDEHK